MYKYPALVMIALVAAILIPERSFTRGIPDPLSDENFTRYRTPTAANEMKLQTLQGRPVSLSELKGKVVLLNFWKIDCPPCALEKPILERIHRRFGGRGLEIVSVNLFDDYARMISYVRQGGFTFTFAFDPNRDFTVKQQPMRSGVSTSFVVNSNAEAIYEVRGVPTTYVIDREGRVVGHAVGMAKWEQRPMLEFLKSLLGPPSPSVATVARRPAYRPAIESRPAGTLTAREPELSARVRGNTARQTSEQVRSKPTTSTSARRNVRGNEAASRRIDVRASRARIERMDSTRRTARESPPSRSSVNPRRSRSVTPSRTTPPAPRSYGNDRGAVAENARTRANRPNRNRLSRTTASSRPAPSPARKEIHTRMNPLPPASPYYRPGTRPHERSGNQRGTLKAPLIYDENGYVMARIPGSDQAPPPNSRSSQPFRHTGGPPPTAYQQPHTNPINGFILESFEGGPSVQTRGGPARRERTVPQAEPSFFGRISSGISSTLSSINPLRR